MKNRKLGPIRVENPTDLVTQRYLELHVDRRVDEPSPEEDRTERCECVCGCKTIVTLSRFSPPVTLCMNCREHLARRGGCGDGSEEGSRGQTTN